jgi:hypothetical protein
LYAAHGDAVPCDRPLAREPDEARTDATTEVDDVERLLEARDEGVYLAYDQRIHVVKRS